MNSGAINFNFLIPLNIPQKLRISHNIVETLLKLSSDMDKSIAYSEHTLPSGQRKLFAVIENLAQLEDKFYVAQLEYSKKFTRFVELTPFIDEVVSRTYNEKRLILTDVDSEGILKIIDIGTLEDLIAILETTCEIIQENAKNYYKRIDWIMNEWKKISDDLLNKLKSFEYRGMKHISNNLRVRILPKIAEMEEQLRVPFTEDAVPRNDLLKQFDEIIEAAQKDIFGNLNADEQQLYDSFKGNYTQGMLLELLQNESKRKSLISLILDDKIAVKFTPLINELY